MTDALTMLEQAAKALYERDPYDRLGESVPWDDVADKSGWLADARAVVEAMRVPSQPMLESATTVPIDTLRGHHTMLNWHEAEQVWTNMLEAILDAREERKG